jgi:uncharacterized membrane protein
MTADNDTAAEPAIFSAVITPHRSLNRTGFTVLMAALVVSFGSGIFFLMLGAWPVFGFLGLDVLIVYLAFRANFRAARAYEIVTVTPSELTVRQVSHRGRVKEWTLNPLWVRLDRIVHEEFGIQRLFLISGSRRVPVAAALAPHEKASFALALTRALGEARRGPTRTALE